ncbi:MAG TPA: metallophosphoesterase [Verrucomicrobiae bacterium]|nr:metallophosphoesterase [Verrucomicrobiae bacterium]
MARTFRIAVVSDIHYAAAEERERCANLDFWRQIKNPASRMVGRAYHRFIWLRHRGAHNNLFDKFLAAAGQPDFVVANGDYSCNTAQIGVSDPAAFASAGECLGKLRARFGANFRATIGDHELGKTGFNGLGSMALASWPRVTEGLGITPFWRVQFGRYLLLGITSSLVALPLYKPDAPAADGPEWEQLSQTHLEEIRAAFAALKPDERVILFCHDPSALPFLWREATVRERISQLEQTIIGHLHTNLVLRIGQRLAGFPTISFLGKSARKISSALGQAKLWKPFHVRLCPALTGIQLLKDGGWLSADLDADADAPARFEFHSIEW